MRGPRAFRGALVTALLAAPLAVLPATPALADEVYPRPANGVFEVEGHGWGHGHGLSQWGAEGAARKGVPYTTILNTYYPSTVQQVAAVRAIRVLINEDDHTDLHVRAASGLAVRDLATNTRYALPAGPTRWRVVADSAGQHVQSYGSAWSHWSTGGKSAFTGPLQFEGPAANRLYLPDGTARDYRGTLRAVRTGTATINVVNVLDLEAYLYGVVPRESSSYFKPEALKAQSVAARSYATYGIDHPKSSSYDICSTTSCQVYGGMRLVTASGSTIELETAATNAAVNATARTIRTYGGKAIFAEFSSSNGGFSVATNHPYLQAKADAWDAIASPHHDWDAQVTAAQLEARYPAVGRLLRIRVTKRDGNGAWGGRVKTVLLEGVDKAGKATTVTTTGGGVYSANTWPRSANGLRGSWWRVIPSYASTVVSRSAVPSLVRPPGVAKGDVVATVRNSGPAPWPVSGLHLAVASPLGAADPLAGGSTRPGVFVANLSRSGASTIEPNEVAKFVVHLDAARVNTGTYAKSYVVRLATGEAFGAAVKWSVPVVDPRFSSALAGVTPVSSSPGPSGADAPPAVWPNRTVVLPRNGSVTMKVRIKNTSNVPWPLNKGVRLNTSDARSHASPSKGASWLSPSVVGPVTSVEGAPSATAVAPGQVGVFPLTLYGNGLGVGVTTESFEAAYAPYHWLDGGKVTLYVVRVDTAVARVAGLHAGLAPKTSLLAYPGDRRSLVIRLRNLGGQAWPVNGADVIMTADPAGRADALRTPAWLSATKATRLFRNYSRPGTSAVYPGEIGEYVVPIDPTNRAAGTYREFFQATSGNTRFGPVVGTTASVAAATFTGTLTRNSTGVVVPKGGVATYTIDLKNTGNVTWTVGGNVVLSAGASKSATPTWRSPSRPAAVGGNLSRKNATTIRPGEIARFTFTIGANGRAPGTYHETFGAGWETWRAMVLSVPVTYTIR
ncbi:MAG: stage sporulation protein [Frankiaceae bacterium]|jgi:SpoIID/LytB domain protein|nr:stage sporulation protein [Frankiaceae bacterium]